MKKATRKKLKEKEIKNLKIEYLGLHSLTKLDLTTKYSV